MNETKSISIAKIKDTRGNLSFIQENKDVPFKIERVYLINDVPGGEIRGGHAFRLQCELIVVLSGSLDLILDNGHSKQKITLNRSYQGVYIPNMIWRHMENFSTNACAMVLSSTRFSELDYIRSYAEFKSLLNE